jgi:hypothetical protein
LFARNPRFLHYNKILTAENAENAEKDHLGLKKRVSVSLRALPGTATAVPWRAAFSAVKSSFLRSREWAWPNTSKRAKSGTASLPRRVKENGAQKSAGRARRDPALSAEVVRSRGVEPADVTSCADKDLRNPPGEGGAECGALSADSGPAVPVSAPPSLHPDVADLARRLAALPESVRAAIVAMVKAADQAPPQERKG